jgi:anti-anti-sigma regulatory factor
MVSLGPELALAQVQAAKQQLVAALHARDAADASPLVLDCSELRTVDAAGLQLLVLLAMHLSEHATALHLHACRPELRQRIEGAALHGWFGFEAREAA